MKALALVPLLLLAAGADADSFQRTVDALRAGLTDPAHQGQSAAALTALGARPAEGESDLAATWRQTGPAPAVYRDRVLGPAYRRMAIAPRASARFEQTFFAGQTARVAVIAVDRAPFALSVTDDDGEAQCPNATAPRCDWVPAWTGRFKVEIANTGSTPANFYIVMK